MKTLFLLCALLITAPALATPTAYSAIIEDLPLMPGMVEKTDQAMVFDNPAGRIIETAAETEFPETDIRGFYDDTLPALGWTALTSSGFVREQEKLTLDIEQKNGLSVVRFNLTPRNASP